MALLVVGAYTTGNGTILRQCIAYAEAHHGIFILRTFGQVAQELANLHKGVASVEVVAVDDTEGLFDNVLAHEHGMVRSPWLLAAFGYGKALRQSIECLEAEFAGHLSLVLGKYLCAELLFKVLTDDPYDLAESGLYGIVDRVVHDCLTVRT